MSIYINQRCQNCGSSLSGWIPNYFTIDEPFVSCPACNAYNDRSVKANEWQLRNTVQKTEHILVSLYWGLAYGVVAAIALVYVLKELSPAALADNASVGALLAPWLIGLICGELFSLRSLYRRVRESNRRMKDGNYLALLAKLGYIKE